MQAESISLLAQVSLAKEILKDDKILEAFEFLSKEQSTRNNSSLIETDDDIKKQLEALRAQANSILESKNESEKVKKSQVTRIYVDGGFDLLHSGHYNALRQVKAMGGTVVAGINSDEDLLLNKGPTIMSGQERAEILRHCKFVDEVKPDTQYTPSFELLQKLDCQYYAHGDDPVFNYEGVDLTAKFKEKGMFKVFKRTEGVSTTEITGRLLKLVDALNNAGQQGDSQKQIQKYVEPPKQQFLATSRRIINFANQNMPKDGDVIGYISGSFDLLHHGHLKRLEEAKKLCDFLYVGIWDDDMTKYYKGHAYPIVAIQERVLMTLACKHVDDVVIGAPYILTEDLLKSLNISKVIHITDTNEDTVLEHHALIDQFSKAKELGMYQAVNIADSFYDITTEIIAHRVVKNQEAFIKKFEKKNASLQKYYNQDKQFVKEE